MKTCVFPLAAAALLAASAPAFAKTCEPSMTVYNQTNEDLEVTPWKVNYQSKLFGWMGWTNYVDKENYFVKNRRKIKAGKSKTWRDLSHITGAGMQDKIKIRVRVDELDGNEDLKTWHTSDTDKCRKRLKLYIKR